MVLIRRWFFLLLFALGVVQIACAQSADSVKPSLHCIVRDGNGIFVPGQSVILDVIFRNTTAPSTLNVILTNVSQPDRPTIAQFHTQIVPNVSLPVSFVTPDKEGVYEVILTAGQETKPTRLPLNIPRPQEQRVVCEIRRQFVVIAPQTPRLVGDWTRTETRTLSPSAEYRNDSFPYSSSRRLLPALPHLPKPPIPLPKLPPFSMGKMAWSEGKMYRVESLSRGEYYQPERLWLPVSQGHFSEKSEQNPEFSALSAAGVEDCAWLSMPMETEIGKPYLVEIDYPVNVPQTLGVAIANYLFLSEGNGYVVGGVNTAATIHVAEEIVQDTPTETVATHRLLFWTKTEHPELVLVNRQPNQEALFRNIRISRVTMPGQQEDQRLPKLFEGTAQRKRIGQIVGDYRSQNVALCFAMDGKMRLNETTIDDDQMLSLFSEQWQPAYEQCSQLLDILCRGGYDGVTLTVLSKNSSLCPMVSIHGNEAVELQSHDNSVIPAKTGIQTKDFNPV